MFYRMPQTHRKDDVGDKSRMLAAGKLSESTLRNVNVINSLEAKMARVKLNVLERNALHSMHRMEHYQEHIQDMRRKTLAYQRVVAKHPIHDAPDYFKALDEKYTLYSFRHEIKDMLHKLHPDTIRKKNAQVLIEASRERYQDAIHSSQEYFNSLLAPKPKFIPSLYYDRKPQFRPSWHEESVFVAKYQKKKDKLPPITQPVKGMASKVARTTESGFSRNLQPITKNLNDADKDETRVTRDEKHGSRRKEQATRNIEDVITNVYDGKNTLISRSLQNARRNVCHATRKDKRHVSDERSPAINFGSVKGYADVNKNDNIKAWVNKIPTKEETTKKRRNKSDSMVPQATDISINEEPKRTLPRISTEDKSQPKTRIRKTYTDKPGDDSDVETPRDEGPRKQYGAHRLKRNQANQFLAHKPSGDDRVHETRNDSGYGTAESDLEITPRLRDGKEWKSMKQSKQSFTQ